MHTFIFLCMCVCGIASLRPAHLLNSAVYPYSLLREDALFVTSAILYYSNLFIVTNLIGKK